MDGKWTRGEGGSKKAENGWTSFVQAPLHKSSIFHVSLRFITLHGEKNVVQTLRSQPQRKVQHNVWKSCLAFLLLWGDVLCFVRLGFVKERSNGGIVNTFQMCDSLYHSSSTYFMSLQAVFDAKTTTILHVATQLKYCLFAVTKYFDTFVPIFFYLLIRFQSGKLVRKKWKANDWPRSEWTNGKKKRTSVNRLLAGSAHIFGTSLNTQRPLTEPESVIVLL